MRVDARAVGSSTLAAAAAAIAAPTAATAADFAAQVVDPPVSWEGWYVGVNAGATWLSSSMDDRGTTALLNYGGAPTRTGSSNLNGNAVGFLAGATAGYNWQHRNFVYGLEADLAWVGGGKANNTGAFRTTYGGYGGYSASRTSRVDGLFMLRARFGFDFNGTLPYLTGGFAWGHTQSTMNIANYGGFAGGTATSSTWVPGVVLGAGIEHQLTPQWTIKGELLWVRFQNSTLPIPTSYGGLFVPVSNGTVQNDMTIGRIGANYRF